jgi:hypothetical protein
MTVPIKLASATSTIPTFLESINLKEPLSLALITALDLEQEIYNINKEIVNNKSINDFNNKDYSIISNATSSKIKG